MWIKWVTIHESYGLPRAAHEFRQYLESRGIQVKLTSKKTKRAGHIYALQVPIKQQEHAQKLLDAFKKTLS